MSKYHTFWPRFWAGCIDGLVFVPVMFIDRIIDSPERGAGLFLAWTTVSTLSFFFYSVLLHWRYGQTLGKRVCGVRVLDLSESRNPNLTQALVRDAGWIAMEIAGLIHVFGLVLSGQFTMGASEQGLGLLVTWASVIWLVLELTTMPTNDKRRALHDMLAKTVVVRSARQMEDNEIGTKAPASVSLAVRAIWIVIAIRVVVSGANLESARLQRNPVAFGVAMTILLVAGLGLLAWINLRIAAGRGWAAVVYLLVTAVVMLGVTQSLSLLFGISSVHGVLGTVAIILHCGAVLLLLRRDSRDWLFARNEAASAA